MKKLIILLAVAVAICAMSVSTLAAWSGFVESPSASGAPTIIKGSSDDGMKISSYRDRADNLSPGQVANFESAYKSAVGYASVAEMNSSISSIANDVKVSPDKLAISDLFYITVGEGDENGIVSLESATFDKFVCLLRYDGSSWVPVEAEKTDSDAIKFDAFPGAYAVVVSTDEVPDHSDDDENNDIVPIIIIAATATAAAAAIATTAAFLLYKKKKPEVPVVAPTPPTFNRRKKGRKVKGNTQRNRNRQRKKKRDKNKNRKRKKHG